MKKNLLVIIGIVLVGLIGGIGGYVYLQKTYPGPALTDELPKMIITYSNTGFSPNPSSGSGPTMVTFKNDSSKPFQPVNDDALLTPNIQCGNPEVGDCSPIPPGDSWVVEFVGGTWLYHDKLNPINKLVINIQNL
jgi:hypothetical protein